jgi:SAM-dependent methyltransferase
VITEAYSEDRYGAEHLRSEFELQYRWALAKVQSLQNFIQSGPFSRPLVVEVGSFVGGFLSAGMDRGWKMLGVDPGKEVAAFCRDQGLEVFCGTLMEAPLKTGTVDAVAIWNTFDQLPNPDSTLATARQVLRNHGILVIRVPNGSSFTQLTAWRKQLSGPAKRWVMAALAWNNLLAFPYLYGYTLPAMDQLLARHGFARLAGRPDTLMTLANESTKTWARWEERLVKWGCLTAARLKQALDEQKYDLAPWLDIYYRAVTSVPDSPLTVARESPVGRT